MHAVRRPTRAAPDTFCHPEEFAKQIIDERRGFHIINNRAPLTDGHVLVVPTEHREGLLDLNGVEADRLYPTLVEVVRALRERLGNVDFEIRARTGDAAQWTISHLHVHVTALRHNNPSDPTSGHEMIYEKQLKNAARPVLEDQRETMTLREIFRKSREMVPNPVATNGNGHAKSELLPEELKIAESEHGHFIAFLSPHPVIEGQVVIMPKRDVRDLADLTREEQLDFATFYKKTMLQLIERYGDGTQSYITVMRTGHYPGMPTERLHLYLFARKEGDQYSDEPDRIYHRIFENGVTPPIRTLEEQLAEAASLRA